MTEAHNNPVAPSHSSGDRLSLHSDRYNEKQSHSGHDPEPLLADPVTKRETTEIVDPGTGQEIERVVTSRSAAEAPVSIYETSKAEMYWFVVVVALSSCVSTIAIPIYFPALNTLASYFRTSVERINLTATMYSIFQGISPLVWATVSDSIGRRPVYLGCLLISIGANVGLAVCNDYWVLFGLRCLQAFGGASTVSLASGVIGDLTQRKNRGGYMGITSGLSLLGNCFGPIIGGALLRRWDWRAMFWFLTINSGVMLFVVFFFLPESIRTMAGTGSRTPKRLINRSLYIAIRRRLTGFPLKPSDPGYNDQWIAPSHPIDYTRPLYLLRQPDVILILVPMSLFYTTWYMVLTAQSTILETRYNMSVEHIGYTYLASGVGTLAASLLSGRVMQWVYRREFAKYQKTCAEKNVPALARHFDIYFARLSMSFYSGVVMIATTLIFAWTLQYKVSFYVPVVMSFFVSATSTYVLNTTNTLLVDLFPDDAATAVSCSNLTRCLLCAAGLSAIDKMDQTINVGPSLSIMSGICAASMLCLYIELRNGHDFAESRRQREKTRAQNKALP